MFSFDDPPAALQENQYRCPWCGARCWFDREESGRTLICGRCSGLMLGPDNPGVTPAQPLDFASVGERIVHRLGLAQLQLEKTARLLDRLDGKVGCLYLIAWAWTIFAALAGIVAFLALQNP